MHVLPSMCAQTSAPLARTSISFQIIPSMPRPVSKCSMLVMWMDCLGLITSQWAGISFVTITECNGNRTACPQCWRCNHIVHCCQLFDYWCTCMHAQWIIWLILKQTKVDLVWVICFTLLPYFFCMCFSHYIHNIVLISMSHTIISLCILCWFAKLCCVCIMHSTEVFCDNFITNITSLLQKLPLC